MNKNESEELSCWHCGHCDNCYNYAVKFNDFGFMKIKYLRDKGINTIEIKLLDNGKYGYIKTNSTASNGTTGENP